MKKYFSKLITVLVVIVLLLNSIFILAYAETRADIIDEDLIDLLNNAKEDDIFSVGIELNYQFDESTIVQPDSKDAEKWKEYKQRLIEAANEYYTEKNTSFCNSIKDLVTVTEIDSLGAVFWCDITKENIYKISEKEEVIHIFLDNMMPVAVEAPESKLSSEALILYDAAAGSDVLSVGIELNYQFDESSIQEPDNKDATEWKNYKQRLIEAANKYYTEVNNSFCSSIQDIATVTEIDTLGPVIWCDITKENLYQLMGRDDVIHVFVDTEPEPAIDPVEIIISGDVNLDGKVTSADARLALRASAKLENLTEIQVACGDMDDDSNITSVDARTILRMAAHLK